MRLGELKKILDYVVDENCKYSNFLADFIVQIASIEQISYQKIKV